MSHSKSNSTEKPNQNDAIAAAISQYEEELHSQLRQYSAQRAWKIMLFIRKAYDLLVVNGWSGKAKFLKWVFLEIPLGKVGLEEYEIRLPVPSVFHSFSLLEYQPSLADGHLVENGARSFSASLYDVVIMPVFDFEFRYQRPQQLAVQFARAGHRVFWLSPTRKVKANHFAPYEAVPLRPNIWEVRLGGPPLSLYTGQLSDEVAEILLQGLNQLWKDRNVAEACAILQFPFWRRLGLLLRHKWTARLLYDCMDDWQNWPTEPFISAANLADERALITEADVVVVTATELATRVLNRGGRPVLAPNAADYDFFAHAEDNGQLSRWSGPIIGYYGAIAAWFDAEAVEIIARNRPQYTIILIGQVHGRDLTGLRALPNVHFLGEKPYKDIPGMLRRFDVALIPFALNALTNAVDPVKMYEYLSQGKPVVASRMPELLQFQDNLYLADSSGDFVDKVDLALTADSSELRESRRRLARQHTWKARYSSMDRAIQAAFPRISLIVVTYNSQEFIEPFHSSILRNIAAPNLEIVFVDNASTDGTPEAITSIAGKDSRVVPILKESNLGFAGGNNLGVKESMGEYLIILNPDTMLPSGSIQKLLRVLMTDNSVGLVAPVTNFSGNETRIASVYGNETEMESFAAELARKRSKEIRDVPMIPLFCAALRRNLWDELGGLDEEFTVGMFEDDDLSLRIQQHGLRTVTAEDCFVHHFGNGSFGKVKSARSLEIFEHNRKVFERKWKRTWHEHQPRPGVSPLAAEPRHSVVKFCQSRDDESHSNAPAGQKPIISRIHPELFFAGHGFNVQPCGNSALVIECSCVTPETIVVIDGASLPTTFGHDSLLTALVPKELVDEPGSKSVYLENSFGTSDPVILHFLDPEGAFE